jgi:hypothetical protein
MPPGLPFAPEGARPFGGEVGRAGDLFWGCCAGGGSAPSWRDPARVGTSWRDLPAGQWGKLLAAWQGMSRGRLVRRWRARRVLKRARRCRLELLLGLAPPAFRPAPATACRSRRATRDRAAVDGNAAGWPGGAHGAGPTLICKRIAIPNARSFVISILIRSKPWQVTAPVMFALV